MVTEEIKRKFINSDHEAFNTVYANFSSAMFGVCLRYTRCKDDAQEILQEGFIKVFKHCNQYSIDKPLGAWIKVIMINTALTYIKKTYRFQLYDEDHYFDSQIDMDIETEELDSLKKQLLIILNKLPDGYRTVFNLFAIENLTHKEIANHLGISENTSKTQYFKARKMIQSLLKSETINV